MKAQTIIRSICRDFSKTCDSVGARQTRGYSVAMSVNGNAAIPCPVLTARSPVWLGASGPCTPSDAVAVIQIGQDSALFLEKTGALDVVMMRAGRKCRLKLDRPIRLFEDDVIQIGDAQLAITGLTAVAIPVPSRRSFLRVLCTVAAVFMLCSFGTDAYAQSADGNDGAKFALPDCDENEPMCLNNNAYRCINHRWKLLDSCKEPSRCTYKIVEKCDASYQEQHPEECNRGVEVFCENAEPCENGRYLCDGKSMYKCKKGKWVLKEKCTGEKFCRVESETKAQCVNVPRPTSGAIAPPGRECVDGQTQCRSGNGIVACSNGYLRAYKEICPEPLECAMEDGKAVCVPPRE